MALLLQGVVKNYGRTHALAGLDLHVPKGSIFGLVGSNGTGKTTALAVAVGLLRHSAGQINVLGAGPFRPEQHAGRVALLPQDSSFPPHARVEELLRFYGRIQGLSSAALTHTISDLLDWVHLHERRQSAVRTLSHGMNRRLAIAQAFLGAPELVLLDEPLNGLDPREAARVRDLICQRRGQQAIVISSHHLSDVEDLCDRVAFIEHGRLVRQDTMEAITHRSHRITYWLGGGAVPLEELFAALPDVVWEVKAEPLTLSATFPETYTMEQLNTLVLRTLLNAGVGILEIRRGTDLESEYLRLSAGSHQSPPLTPANVAHSA